MAERNGTDADNGGIWWDWRGKSQSTGLPVHTGTFKATLTVTNDETGESDTAVRNLTAKSDTINKRVTKTHRGTQTSSRSHARSCYVTGDSWDHSLNLDCWGGHHATARYGFSLPHNARRVSWSVRGSRGCCDNGRVTKTGKRTSAGHHRVVVKVTNWASYTVRRVSVSYTTRVHR